MVNPAEWNRPGSDGRTEFEPLFEQFFDSLRANGVYDLYYLGTEWWGTESNGRLVISNGKTELEGVSSTRRDVIEALYNDACANLNR